MNHPVAAASVQAFAARNGLPAEALRSGGRLTLTVDGRWRVHLQPTTHRRIAIHAPLRAWPAAPDGEADRALERLLRTGAGMLQKNASTLALDAGGNALVLQQCVSDDAAPAVLDDAFGEFCNALAFWSRLCTAETARMGGVRP